ncbi:EAL domain-containing protein [Stenotrophomonas sp. MMGLT7]|uniref:putative bifunctional diguanylate cyclase/phosphodiesterase n=1 Tax=Stenotrophomonas sp. MMGLT7 TaxID=2901227 RepID=UPI001E471934|nr:EAL domain-containing protein [Stenotrophomonas sp. MMGLT7]MCD7100405.1 EAL domain-containing protein [Stenotrophomonas sp. MMGLT7]
MSAAPYPLPPDEEQRLRTLADYHLLDTPPEQEFDRLANLAARLFDVPIVLISLLDRDRQFFKAEVGLGLCGTSREVSFCAHAIVQDDILFVPDAMKDPRFATNPLVLGPPFIRFYAGKPLVSPEGEKIGTVCLIDHEPRSELTAADRSNLADIAALVMERMEMRRLDHVRSISQTRFENIAATSPDAIICSNLDGDITFWNPAAERLFGYRAEEIMHRPGLIIVPDSWRPIYDVEMQRLREGGRMELADHTIELSGLRRDGSEFPAEFSLSTWKEGNGTSIGAIVRDISERRRNEERLFRLASLDTLTELPNRATWRACLEDVLASERPSTMLMLDLDGFKEVNDTLGHSAGDAVLKEVGARICATCDDAIIVARLGGDEFAVLLPGNRASRAVSAAERLLAEVSRPYVFAGKRLDVGVSIGVSLGPQHGVRPEELQGAADLALYRAKAAGKGGYQLFTAAFRQVAVARRAFEQELRQAFENGEFELYYQPQMSIRERRLTGAEALLRWNHPQRGLLTPASFIEVLSQKPSAAAIGEWILRSACRQAAKWRTAVPGFRMGVNLFEAQFRSGRMLTSVREALMESALPAETLELEIVENVLLRNDQATVKLLNDLRRLGVGLAFDDYGTGFASLSLLKNYPVTRLKIDRSFVQGVSTSDEDAAVVKVVLYLGRIFGMGVIAEGVENQEQLEFLAQNNCEQAQGYLFGKPCTAAEFEDKFVHAAVTQ